VGTLTATSWSVRNIVGTGTVFEVNNESLTIEGKKKYSHCKLVLTTSGSAPLAGIPLPTFGRVGLVRHLDYYILVGPHTMTTALVAMSVTGVHLTISTGGDRVRFFRNKSIQASGSGQTGAITRLATTATLGSGLTIICTAVGW